MLGGLLGTSLESSDRAPSKNTEETVMKTVKKLAFGSVCALTIGMASSLAIAQATQQDPMQQQDPAQQQQYDAQQYGADQGAPAAQTDVSDDKLQTYAEAEQKVQEIRDEFQQQMPEAETPEDAQALQQEAQQEMVSAVEDAGLTVEEYNQLASLMQTNPELRERMESLR